jgi:hypothetical protein
MPKKVNVSSNQRIDLDDFTRAASDYTQESGNFSREQLVLARRSIATGGFRIEISDQATSPGEFTIYNGSAVDKSGNILNNEQAVADARVLTLQGNGLEHYIEIEFVETESDVDSRAFWDPTFPGNNPPGKEFSLNVATRKTPDWQVVQPASTTAFTVTGTINSNRIPIAVLYTNGSGEIDGFTAVNASTVLEEDVGASATKLRVLDSTLFPTTGDATVGGTSISITGNDRTNGILTISPVIGGAKQAGAIVLETIVTAAFLPLETAPLPDVPSGTESKDQRRSLFKGDEIRGSALVANPQDAAARSDIQVKSLKDQVDFLAAQIREMKFGDLRTDVNGGLPPTTWTSTRYYDSVGGLAGARNSTISVGDASLSFGDVNTTASEVAAALQTAHDALDSTNGGSIYVKEGDYVWNSTLTVDRPVSITFGPGVNFVAGTYSSAGLEIDTDSKVEIVGLPLRLTGEAVTDLEAAAVNTVGLTLVLRDSNFGRLIVPATIPAASVSIRANYCSFRSSTITATEHAITFANDATDRLTDTVFTDCSIAYNASAADSPTVLVYGNLNGVVFRRCTFDAALNTRSCDGFVFTDAAAVYDPTDWTFDGCSFVDTGSSTVERGLTFDGFEGVSYLRFTDCIFDFHFDSTPTVQRVIDITAAGVNHPSAILIDNCDFSPIGTNTIPNTSTGTRGTIVYIEGNGGQDGLQTVIINSKFGKPIVGDTIPSDFVNQVNFICDAPLLFHNNTVSSFVGGLIQEGGFLTATGNQFRFDNGIANWKGDTYGISYDNASGELIISENTFSFKAGENVLTSSECVAIDLPGSPTDDNYTGYISNNDISIDLRDGLMCGIRVINPIDNDEINIVGNKIIVGDGFISAASEIYGIELSESTGYRPSCIISNNSIGIVSTTAAGGTNAYGIRARFAGDDEGFAGLIISNNVINQTYGNNTGAADYGIFVKAVGCVITGNTINSGGRTASPVAGVQIYTTGHIHTISNNILMNQNGSQNGVNIQYESTNADFLDAPGNISITGNSIMAGGAGCIDVNINHNEIRNINITGNSIGYWPGSTISTSCINIDDDGHTTCGSYVVSNNTIREGGTISVGNIRRMILLDLDAGTEAVAVNGNSIWAMNTTNVLRSTALGCIHVVDGVGITVNSNSVYNWGGTGIANRAGIRVVSATNVACVGNNVDYAGVAGEDCIEIDSCTSVNISANQVQTGGFSTSGSSDVISTGSNNS